MSDPAIVAATYAAASPPKVNVVFDSLKTPSFTSSELSTALPQRWTRHWTFPAGERAPRLQLRAIEKLSRSLAEAIPKIDLRSTLGPLVGSQGLRTAPVHRWFAYKEGFSPDLLDAVINLLGLGADLKVIDPFGGVGTTALAGVIHPQVAAVRSVEYSPLSHFVGSVKLLWPTIDPDNLDVAIEEALRYRPATGINVPTLSSFSNADVISPQRLRSLLTARDHVRWMKTDEAIRGVLLLGLAAVLEDLSGVMKDGRALRIKRGRRRRPSSLATHPSPYVARGAVKRALANQWSAMAADIRLMQGTHERAYTPALFVAGDARSLSTVMSGSDLAFPRDWANLSLFSPPYLNFLDYTELYKLELWFLELVRTQQEFRQVRLGTLRSHPSIRFAHRSYLNGHSSPTVDLIEQLSAFATEHGRRNDVGPTIRSYFDDMFQVWVEQGKVLKSGATAACVVANSTFTRRERAEDGSIIESWRLPLLTDVLLAHLAKLAGFEDVYLLEARHLRPRNTGAAVARESVVVARKA